MEEIWKPLQGYDYPYLASNTGKIKKSNYELKPVRFPYDGNFVTVQKENKKLKRLVSRLIAECFLDLDRNDLTKRVIHIDGDVNNDSVDNLKIVDRTHINKKNYAKSGVSNVTWYQPNKKWKIAFVKGNPRRMIHIGYFIDMQDAIDVYRNWESSRAGKIPDTKYPGLVHIKAESKWRVDVFDKHANIYHIDYYDTEHEALEDWKMYNWILDQS